MVRACARPRPSVSKALSYFAGEMRHVRWTCAHVEADEVSNPRRPPRSPPCRPRTTPPDRIASLPWNTSGRASPSGRCHDMRRGLWSEVLTPLPQRLPSPRVRECREGRTGQASRRLLPPCRHVRRRIGEDRRPPLFYLRGKTSLMSTLRLVARGSVREADRRAIFPRHALLVCRIAIGVHEAIATPLIPVLQRGLAVGPAPHRDPLPLQVPRRAGVRDLDAISYSNRGL